MELGRDRERKVIPEHQVPRSPDLFPYQYSGKLPLAVVQYLRPANFKRTFQVKSSHSLPLSASPSAFQQNGALEQGCFHHKESLCLGLHVLPKQAQSSILGITLVTDAGGTWNMSIDG